MGKAFVAIADLRGGRNGADPPLSLPDTQCVEAINVDWYEGTLAHKRGGSDAVAQTAGTVMTLGIQTLIRHIPSNSETAAELWAIDGAATPIVKRLTGGTNWADVTVSDAIASKPQDVVGASLNGKLFLAYDSSKDRLHCYDPSLASPLVRVVGLAASTAPTAADAGGAGAYAAVKRYYKQDTIQLDTARIVRRSELSASCNVTPDGGHLNIQVTRGAFPSEGETHWRVWASTDDVTYYNISGNIAVGTTTYTDVAATTTYNTNTAADVAGTYTVPTSAKYILTDGNRLLMSGNWESGKNSRVYYTPVLGSSDQGDDERTRNTTTQKDYVDVNENDGGFVTALGGPLAGSVYVYKYRQVWKLIPTGDVATPYIPRKLRDDLGCISHKSVVMARDKAGNAALYWLSTMGPCRAGSNGIEYLGRDVEDLWAGINLAATSVVSHGVYHQDKHQIWWWISTGANNSPDTKIVLDILLADMADGDRVRGGWAKHTGDTAGAQCSCMFSKTLAASMSRDLKPYIGRSSGTVIQSCDSATTTDAGTTFQAYVKTKPILPATSLGTNVGIGQTHLLAKTASGVTITQTIDRDWALETRTATVVLTAAASETRVLRKIEGSDMSQAGVIQIQIGDGSAASNTWTLDAIAIPVHSEDVR
jgi:hypothetical protein